LRVAGIVGARGLGDALRAARRRRTSISVVTNEQIQQSPAVVADDVLRQVPTFSRFLNQQPGGESYGASVSLRGLVEQSVERSCSTGSVQRSLRGLGVLDARAADECRSHRDD
jgi:hypothetical protein